MNLFDLFRRADIDRGVEELKSHSDGVLLDVRTWEEYCQGHIPGSENLDVGEISRAAERFPKKDTPIFLYCRSGARSGQAAFILKKMGYTNVTNIGGMMDYRGEIAR